MAKGIVNFFNEIKLEMGKVSWPTRQELIGSTIIVLISVALLSAFVGACDLVLSSTVNFIMSKL